MDVSKTKTPPVRAEMKFGSAQEDILVLLLDPDIITSDFLIEMDSSARRIFNSQLAGVRRVLQRQGRLPEPDTSKPITAEEPVEDPGTPEQTKSSEVEAEIAREVQKITEDALRELEEILPREADSIPLAQAQQLTYMAETLAKVILDWELVENGKKVPITETRDLECCRAEAPDCRHAGAWLRTRSRQLLERFFQFCCFEAPAPEKKTG